MKFKLFLPSFVVIVHYSISSLSNELLKFTQIKTPHAIFLTLSINLTSNMLIILTFLNNEFLDVSHYNVQNKILNHNGYMYNLLNIHKQYKNVSSLVNLMVWQRRYSNWEHYCLDIRMIYHSHREYVLKSEQVAWPYRMPNKMVEING